MSEAFKKRGCSSVVCALVLTLGPMLAVGCTLIPSMEEKPTQKTAATSARWSVVSSENRNSLTDSTGTSVPVAPVPSRIITLMPSLGELVSALDGNADRLIGVSEYSDFPEVLKKKPSVGPYQNVNLEQIRTLKPDLILASRDGNSRDQIERLREWGYRVAVMDSSTLASIQQSIEFTSRILQNSDARSLDFFLKAMSEARSRGDARSKKKRILLQVGDDPLIVVGGKNYLNEVIELIGARNIYSDSSASYPRVSHEDILKKNPDQILVLTLHGNEAEFEKMKERWKRFPSLKAVKENDVKTLRADSLLRPGVRLPEGWKELERAVYLEKASRGATQ